MYIVNPREITKIVLRVNNKPIKEITWNNSKYSVKPREVKKKKKKQRERYKRKINMVATWYILITNHFICKQYNYTG